MEQTKEIQFMGTTEAAEKWGYSQRQIQEWCRNEKICFTIKAEKINNRWIIPKNAECPKPIRSGK